MTVKQLEYVLAVAQCGSLSRAAARLYVAQPTLSEMIQNLERELGFSIFARSRSGMTLTADGEMFVTDAQSVIEQMRYLKQRYEKHSEECHRFSMSSTHFYFTEAVFARIARELEGKCSLRHLDSRKLDVIEEVARGVSELGILNYYEEDNNRGHILRELKNRGLEYHVLGTLTPAAFLSVRHPLAKRKTLKMEELKSYPRCTFFQGPLIPRQFSEEWFEEGGWDRELVVQDNGAVTILLQETDCFSIGSGIIPEVFQKLGLTTVPVEDISDNTIIWIKKRNHELSAIGRRCVELCKEEIKRARESQLSI